MIKKFIATIDDEETHPIEMLDVYAALSKEFWFSSVKVEEIKTGDQPCIVNVHPM